MKQLTLRWHGHACFALTCDGYTVVFDPYEDNYVPGLSPLDVTGDLVLCSHGHGDHNAAGLVKPGQGGENPFRITKIDTYHDPEQGRLRGENTIHVLQTGDLRLAHFGDIGCPLTPAQAAELQGLDVALIPVGGFYTIGPQEAKELMDTIRPKIVIPMHYRKGEVGLPAVGPVEDFLALVGDYVYYPGDTITINAGTEPQEAKELMDTIRPKIVIPMHYRKGEVGLTAVGPVEDFLALVGDYVYYPGDTITINAGTEPQVAVLTYQG